MTKVVAVAAIGKNRELGKNDKLLWHIPEDLKRFNALTRGHPIVMGRKTFESIVGYLGKPLPERTSIIVTREPHYDISKYGENVAVVHSVEEGIEKGKELDAKEVHIGGGAQIYAQALPYIDKLCLTLIDAEATDADSFFPEYEKQFIKKTFEEAHEWKGIPYRFVDLER